MHLTCDSMCLVPLGKIKTGHGLGRCISGYLDCERAVNIMHKLYNLLRDASKVVSCTAVELSCFVQGETYVVASKEYCQCPSSDWPADSSLFHSQQACSRQRRDGSSPKCSWHHGTQMATAALGAMHLLKLSVSGRPSTLLQNAL